MSKMCLNDVYICIYIYIYNQKPYVMVLNSEIMPQSYMDVDRLFMTMTVINLIERRSVHA